MDPLSQAALGASLSQSFAKDKSKQFSALVIGALAGMAPDLDMFIRSEHDPLLFLEFHRQFTHSLIFIPFGALLCSLLFYPFIKSKLSFVQVYLFSLLGYATHGLLDACTSYGTQLFWPFSNERVAWGTVSIVDPMFTLPIIILVALAVYKKNVTYARTGFIYAVLFLSLGLVQKNRAEQAVYLLAEERGHYIERSQIKPGFGNRHVWKLMYEYDGRYYVDAVRLLWHVDYIKGSSIQKLNVQSDFPWLPEGSQQAKDIERFRWFSDDFLAISPRDKNLIIDARYSYLPNRIGAMWGIEIKKEYIDLGMLDKHVGYMMNNGMDEKTRRRFWEMLF
jgi:inner membrane protein